MKKQKVKYSDGIAIFEQLRQPRHRPLHSHSKISISSLCLF